MNSDAGMRTCLGQIYSKGQTHFSTRQVAVQYRSNLHAELSVS